MTENPQPKESAVTPDTEVPAEPDVTAPADEATGPEVAVTESERTEERLASGIETAVEGTPHAAEPALQNVPSTPKETPVPAEPDVTAPADEVTGPEVAVTKSERTEERLASGIETAVEGTPHAAEPALQNVPSTPKETPPATMAPPPMTPRRSGPDGGRRFASQGRSRREDRENTEEITDPRMRSPAVYEPRTGPSHSRFNPRQPIAPVDMDSINYKNVTVLTRFIDQQGRILSRRKSRVNAKTQRRIKIAIKQARHLALLPYTPTHIQGHRRR